MKRTILFLVKRACKVFSVLILMMLCKSGFAQQVTVQGVVRDTVGGLPGVSVKIEGTAGATQTDALGRFNIKADPTSVLAFTFVGFAPQKVQLSQRRAVNGTITLDVLMKSSEATLEEVTVVAYGTQKKTSVVSSITSIEPEELKGPTSNLTTMMAGRVTGMIAYQRSGEPGSDNAQFFIRGLGTFGSGKVDPLILIDGIESTQNDLARLQPDDIASFNVLKDATAAAVYGARGANGVLLILTKTGKAGVTKFSARAETSVSSNTRNFQFADNITYMKLANEAALTRNRTSALPYHQTKIDATAAGENPLLFPNNNWIDQLIKDNTINHRYNMSMQGGSDKARYYVAGTYNIDNGVLKVDGLNDFNNNIKLKNYSVRSNVDLKLTSTTQAAIKVYGQFDDYSGPVVEQDGNGNRINGGQRIFRQAIWSNPVMFPAVYPASLSPYTTHPMFGNAPTSTNSLFVNPYAEMVRGYSEYNSSTLQTQLELKQELEFITKGLNARMMTYARRYAYFDVSRQYNPFYYFGSEQPDGAIGVQALNAGGLGSIGTTGTEYLDYSEGNKELNSTFYVEAALNYSRTFNDKHAVGGMLITTLRNYLSGNPGSLQRSLPSRNQGLSGRATYAYDNRYLAEFNFGYNGSERFSSNDRFGFFPSFGLGYVVSNEKFFEPLTKYISNLKLRATYGFVGSDQIGNSADRFFYMSEVNMNNGTYGSVFGEQYGYSRPGVLVSRYANPLITWERSEQVNLGLDMSFLDGFNMSVDVYKNSRSNILTARTFIPSTMGLQATVQANTNKGESKGVDFALNYNKDFRNTFYVQGRSTLTYATSKILIYDEPTYNTNEAYRYRAGYSMSQTFGYVAERLFVDDNEANNSPKQFSGTPGVDYGGGDIKYRDINRDGIISDADRVAIGHPTSPELIYGFGGTLGFKGFDVSVFFQGSARSSFFINSENIAPFVFNGGSQNGLLSAIADSYWSEENRDIYAMWPRLSSRFVANNNQTSTWWMRNGGFLRLKSAEIGYNIPDKLQKRLRLINPRLYVNATNLGIWSNYSIWDPEMGGNGLGYPVQTVYNIGISTSF